jgi:hypothetical protein
MICKEVICDMPWGIHLQLFAFSIHFFCPVFAFKPCSGYWALQFWGFSNLRSLFPPFQVIFSTFCLP